MRQFNELSHLIFAVTLMKFFLPFCNKEIGTKKVRNLPKVTQLISMRTRIQISPGKRTQVAILSSSFTSPAQYSTMHHLTLCYLISSSIYLASIIIRINKYFTHKHLYCVLSLLCPVRKTRLFLPISEAFYSIGGTIHRECRQRRHGCQMGLGLIHHAGESSVRLVSGRLQG